MPKVGSQHRNKYLATLRTLLVVGLVASAIPGPTLAGPFEDATAAYDRGDYATALRVRLEMAEQGDPAAQVVVGLMYARGHGVPRDYAQGYDYETGRVVLVRDDAEAAPLDGKAAGQGNTVAQSDPGAIAKNGNAAPGTSKCKMVQIDQWLVRFSRDRWLVIEGAINGKNVGILLDTGAMRTMIFRPLAERLGLMMRPMRNNYMSGFGGISAIESAHVGEFRVGGSTRTNWYMMVAGENDPGDGIGVVLGEDFFQNVDVEFDLANRAVRLFQPKNCNGVSLAYWTSDRAREVEMEDVDPQRPRIVVPVKVNGLPIVALFDTGAATSVLHRKTADRLGVRPDSPGVVVAGKFVGVGAGSTDVWVGPFESFEIGDEAIKTTSIQFGDTPNGTQMVLGMDFLLAHRLLVSHSQRKIYFTHTGGPVFQKSNAPRRGED